jgi:hypothetical protein
MLTMRRMPFTLSLLLAFVAPTLPAQQAPAARPRVVSLQDSSGTPMSVIGLRRWTVPMIEDSIAKYAPGQSMRSHACQAILQYKLGFPSASVVHYMSKTADGKESSALVVTVVEPQDSVRLSWRRVTASAKPRIARWSDLYAPVTVRYDSTKPPEVAPGHVAGSIQDIALARVQTAEETRAQFARMKPAMRDSLAAFRERLGARISDADLALAIATIRDDGSVDNRMLAAAVLSNFHGRAEAWHALVEALLDRDERVRGPAQAALANMTRGRKVAVDWRPVVPQLRAILGGTGVGAIPDLLRTLVETGITPELATAVLVGNADYVLAQASLSHPWASWGAKQFLGHASGKAGATVTVGEWEAWLREEEAKREQRTGVDRAGHRLVNSGDADLR